MLQCDKSFGAQQMAHGLFQQPMEHAGPQTPVAVHTSDLPEAHEAVAEMRDTGRLS